MRDGGRWPPWLYESCWVLLKNLFGSWLWPSCASSLFLDLSSFRWCEVFVSFGSLFLNSGRWEDCLSSDRWFISTVARPSIPVRMSAAHVGVYFRSILVSNWLCLRVIFSVFLQLRVTMPARGWFSCSIWAAFLIALRSRPALFVHRRQLWFPHCLTASPVFCSDFFIRLGLRTWSRFCRHRYKLISPLLDLLQCQRTD
jgi:hypothetical protein